jgi:hypothetical protein
MLEAYIRPAHVSPPRLSLPVVDEAGIAWAMPTEVITSY